MPNNRRTLALEQLFRRDQEEWARQVSRVVADLYGVVRSDDLRNTIRTFTGSASVAIRAGQVRSATMAQGFIRALTRLESGAALELEAAPIEARIAGTTADGRALSEALAAVGPTIFVALQQGRSLGAAIELGRIGASRFAATETIDAGRREVADQGLASSKLVGWVWIVSSAGGCAACLASADNRVREFDEPMEAHPWCGCIRSPVVADATQADRPSGEDIYAGLGEQEQAETFHGAGERKAELVASGRVSLQDLVTHSESHSWRGIVSERPLSDLDTGEV